MLSRLKYWSGQLIAHLPALLPSSCALCSADCSDGLCHGCRQQFLGVRQARCRQCASVLAGAAPDGGQVCGACLAQPPAFDATLVAADYVAPLDQLVLALKFGQQLALAPLCSTLLRDALLEQTGPEPLPTLLTAVPLGQQRLAERGFNQALEIARPLARALGIPLVPALVARVRDTRPQARLHPDQRQRNIRHGFLVPPPALERVRGQHIGVVDDVMTTGATLNELAATLKRFGAARVTNLVFARTPHH
jgi:ComF family protein